MVDYNKINTAAPGGGIFILPGIYRGHVKACKEVKGFKGESFVAEILVLESSNPARPVGSTMSAVWNMTKHEMAFSNIRDFVAKCLNVAFEAVLGDHVRAAVSEANVLADTELKIIATEIETKEKKQFTKVQFEYLGGGYPAKIAAAQAAQQPARIA